MGDSEPRQSWTLPDRPKPTRPTPGGSELAEGEGMAEVVDSIMQALQGIYDPCCYEQGISVVDMGLLRTVRIDDRAHVTVELVLTTGWCPFATSLVSTIQARMLELPEITDATVNIVWDEPWTSERLSDNARRKLRFLPSPRSLEDQARYGGAERMVNHLG
jgi:metal-sulfur cluster biosynthetic enzyme